ncbi:MAG: DNA primase [Deltaproteobacteria bacterium ADurb.Bin135]|jgi:hypothetical protein|nr:MAG: DNA primase [Deltaproteobacteria bacterium ADurb.Bin135]
MNLQKPDILTTIESAGFAPKRKGKHYWMNCAFHEEKTDSCILDTDKQRFYCFGCGASGDSISFIQKLHGLTFRETLRYLNLQDPPKIDSQQQKKRTLVKAFREWEKSLKKGLADYYRDFHAITKDLQTWDEAESFADDFHLISLTEYYLEILTSGTDEEKYNLMKRIR